MYQGRIRKKGAGGGGGAATQGGGMDVETPVGKTPVPHPRTKGCRVFDASQSFYGPAGGLDAKSHWELCFLH